jgi:hypothetical protein
MSKLSIPLPGKIAIFLLVVFISNIFYGKAVIYFSLTPLFIVSDVAEFLMLFLACLFFVAYSLIEEYRLKNQVK